MRKLSAFNFITLNGYYKGINEDTSWHQHTEEGAAYSTQQMKSGNTLIFGRKTYEMMYSFWPGPMAAQYFPEVAKGMNAVEKIVISKTLSAPEWNNTTLLPAPLIDGITALKKSAGKNLTILGSGSIIAQLVDHNLIDEFQFMIDPVTIPAGTEIFHGCQNKIELELISTKVFNSGAILATYQPKK